MATGRPRGHTTSSIFRPAQYPSGSASIASPLSRVTSSPSAPGLDGIEDPQERGFDGVLKSSFRLRARSHSCSPAQRFIGETVKEEDESKDNLPLDSCPSPSLSGNDVDEFLLEPWTAPPGKDSIPEDLREDWEDTRERVSKASISVMGVTKVLVRRALILSVSASEYVPIPGLMGVAKMLLVIWDAAQTVDMNRLACMRLARRCADIVLCVRQEVREAGDVIRSELFLPLSRLVDSFKRVHAFLQKQLHYPFLKRFIKRDEILGQIQSCHDALDNSIGMFNLSIQVRVLRQVQESEHRRAQDAHLIMSTLLEVLGTRGSGIHGLPQSSSHSSLAADPEETSTQAEHPPQQASPPRENPCPLLSPTSLPPTQILPALRTLHSTQNTLDAQRDMVGLRTLMRDALETKSDVEMMKVLQIGREEMPDAIGTLERALEKFRVQEKDKEWQRETKDDVKTEPPVMAPTEKGERLGKDPLDREFVESGIDALRRMSMGAVPKLPSWTITRYEYDQDEKVGVGFFSDVFKGTWRGRTVAIKILADVTPRKLFVREVEIWKDLKHENVLELYGASSAQGDPPWFFVSPYAINGSLVEYLKRDGKVREKVVGLGLTLGESDVDTRKSKAQQAEDNLFRFMWEIAKGMEYLHENGVLHGDLKAANVLVDDLHRCIITDFGQSEMRSEAYRISGTPPPRGTLRWQAPELLSGLNQHSLTPQMDVYAYAICCIEVLTMGKMPWQLMDDENVRYLVLTKDARPSIPSTRFTTPRLLELLRVCWHRDSAIRPTFRHIVRETQFMHEQFCNPSSHPSGSTLRRNLSRSSIFATMWDWDSHSARPPPSMRSAQSSHGSSGGQFSDSPDSDSNKTVRPSLMSRWSSTSQRSSHRRSFSSSSTMTIRMPEPMFYTPPPPSCHGSFVQSPLASPYGGECRNDPLLDVVGPAAQGRLSPPPCSPPPYDLKKHRRTSSHSVTFPLANPPPVTLGTVGYLSKVTGTFVTLFNAFQPDKSANMGVRSLPSLYFYIASSQREKRKSAQAVWGAFVGMLSPNSGKSDGSSSPARRPSLSNRGSPKPNAAKKYHYVESFEAAQKWLKAHGDAVVQIYGPSHHIEKDDIFLVTGTLEKPEQHIFMNHPAGQAHVNVFSSPEISQFVRSVSTTSMKTLAGVNRDSPVLGSPLQTSSECSGALDQRRCLESRALR